VTVVPDGKSKTTQVVLDSAEVRQVIASSEIKTAEIHHDLAMGPNTIQEWRRQIMPSGTTFLAAMASAPHIMVKENTRCRMLEISKAGCTPYAEATVTYVRVVITNGDSKGQQAWICRNPYSLPFESP
jgi:hypothetical protein